MTRPIVTEIRRNGNPVGNQPRPVNRGEKQVSLHESAAVRAPRASRASGRPHDLPETPHAPAYASRLGWATPSLAVC